MRRKPRKFQSSSSESSEDESPTKKPPKTPKLADDSSSESDIENYLQPIDQIDLNSPFFDIQKDIPSPLDQVEDDVFEPEEENEFFEIPSTSKSHFQQLHDYTKKIEEAKKSVDAYKIRQQTEEEQTDVMSLLATAETKLLDINLHSSDFESCSGSEVEGWEEVEEAQSIIPKENLEITVEMPGDIKKKKKQDLVAVIKRRINRIKKMNQLLIHKVHLLCWIAHGNYINAAINSPDVAALALSLVPPEPARPTDLNYIEQVVKWYKNCLRNVGKTAPKNKSLEELLEVQIAKKEAYDGVMLIYIFVAILRSLRVPCRLVLSLQVEPVRPPKSELISLSTKNNNLSKPRMSNCNVSKLYMKKTRSQKLKEEESTNQKARLAEKQSAKTAKPHLESAAEKKTKNTRPKRKESAETRKTRAKAGAEAVKVESLNQEAEATKETRSKVKVSTEIKKTRSKVAAESKKIETSNQKTETTMEVKEIRMTRSKSATEDKKYQTLNVKVGATGNSRSKSATDSNEKVEKPKRSNLKKKKESPKLKTTGKKPQTQTSSTLITAFLRKTKARSVAMGKSQKSPKIARRSQTSSKILQLDGANDDSSDDGSVTTSKPKLRSLPWRLVKQFQEYKTSSESDEDDSRVRSLFSPRNTRSPRNLPKTNKSVDSKIDEMIEKHKEMMRKRRSNEDSDNDSDYTPDTKKKHLSDNLTPSKEADKPTEINKIPEKIQDVDLWAEIYSETEKRWISVDVIEGQVDCVDKLYTRATPPVSYVLAWLNNNTIKDVTSRYCKNFNTTTTRRLRVDPKWWATTLKPFTGPKNLRDKAEDEELERQQLEIPLPKTIKEYKNHPLYVLKRHLLKYEALYPPDTPTIGFVRKEPVYPRQAVHILHPRDIWFKKKAKVVKPGEKAYKIVKGRPRWDKLSRKIVTDPEMDIFGPWQVEDYEPPTAENGVVPRNAYGNVELFKACMLPKKTVHLRLPGLNKIARRMNIDCAPAFTGYDYSAGWVHPAYDGYVVCEEYADILVAAWELEQDELEQKEQEKIDKRVYGNWKRLIKGLLIRERLKAKYDFGNVSGARDGKKDKKGPRFATKKRK